MNDPYERYLIDRGYCADCLLRQGGRRQRVYLFPNGMGASLISSPSVKGDVSWDLVVLAMDDSGELVPSHEHALNDHISRRLGWDEVLDVLHMIMEQ